MTLLIVLLIILLILLFLLFYPLRVTLHISYLEGKDTEKIILHPVLMIKKIGITVYDSEHSKQKKKKKGKKGAKAKEKEKEKAKAKAKKELKPLNELIPEILSLMKRFKKGLKRLRVRLRVAYGFSDPAVTGEATGAIYAALPLIFGDMRRSRWRIGIYPVWCTESITAAVDGDIRICIFDLILAFGNMLPKILKILPKKKKKTEEVK
jgi:hypothetical protein